MGVIEQPQIGEITGAEPPRDFPMMNGDFEGKSIVTIDQYSREDIEQVLVLAGVMEQLMQPKPSQRRVPPLLRGMVMKAVMFEDSSRTAGSFLSAAAFLGAYAERPSLEASSMNKGETALETVRCFAGQSDALMIRHADDDFMDKVAASVDTPFVCGGAGKSLHVTQTLKDLYTFAKDGPIDGQRYVLIGDGSMNRPARMLLRGLTKFEDVEVVIVAPEFMRMPPEVIEQARNDGLKVTETDDLRPLLREPGKFYLSRPRSEYYKREGKEELLKQVEAAYTEFGYNYTPENWAAAHAQADAYHALPYKDEIDARFHADPRAKYHAQEDNGVFVHMANNALLLNQEGVEHQQRQRVLPLIGVLKPTV